MEYFLFVLEDKDRKQLSAIKLFKETVKVWLQGFLLSTALLCVWTEDWWPNTVDPTVFP